MWGGVKVKHFCAMGEQLHTVGRRPHTRLCLSLLPPRVVQVASQQSCTWLSGPSFAQ